MRPSLVMTLALLTLAPALAGCVTDTPPAGEADASAGTFPACEHPWPCADGSEWPVDLPLPEDGFALAERTRIRVPMADGVELDGAVWLPEVPDGTALPTLLWVTPYRGQCKDDPACQDAPADSEELEALFDFVWQNGYAAAAVSLRGTGLSQGCFDYYGAPSQRDMAELVTWLAEQPWSNGRVGMWGISAMGTTPWMAAIGAPPALKAIAPSGIISDLYLNRFTPQGASFATSGAFQAQWGTLNSVAPPGGVLTGRPLSQWPDGIAEAAENHPERLCPEVAEWESSGLSTQYTDDGHPAFWEERRLVKDFGNVTAAVLVQHGFHEGGHAFQDDAIWPTLEQTPRRMWLGQWGHTIFPDDQLAEYQGGSDTRSVLLSWFDFWLKGLGDPPRVGVVDYQVAGAGWAQTSAWPPAEATSEVLHLTSEGLRATSGDGRTLTTAQAPQVIGVEASDCGAEVDQALDGGAKLLYMSEPVDDATTIAGNAMGYFELTSDKPGGILAVDLFTAEASGECMEAVAHGAIDLRRHDGSSMGTDFPVGQATWVRVDLWSSAFHLSAGERVLVILSGSGKPDRSGQAQYAPTLDVSGESHLVLPIVEGTLGGEAPTLEYPPRPRI